MFTAFRSPKDVRVINFLHFIFNFVISFYSSYWSTHACFLACMNWARETFQLFNEFRLRIKYPAWSSSILKTVIEYLNPENIDIAVEIPFLSSLNAVQMCISFSFGLEAANCIPTSGQIKQHSQRVSYIQFSKTFPAMYLHAILLIVKS